MLRPYMGWRLTIGLGAGASVRVGWIALYERHWSAALRMDCDRVDAGRSKPRPYKGET